MTKPQQHSIGASALDAGSVSGLLQGQARIWPDHELLCLPDSVAALWPEEREIWRYGELAQAVETLA
ncbi:MAG: hypothetical protein KJZ59_12270, partial [Pararhodobacter sp.]|nr:hypothetical protein [Pararhodobacter sp.]